MGTQLVLCLLLGDSGLLAGDVGMSILLAGVVVWISVVGPAGMAVAVGLDVAVPTWSRSECLCPNLRDLLPPLPLLPLPHPTLGRVQRDWERI